VRLTAENTAIVVDSTADFPEAPTRFPNWRVVPLYVRFGDESFRDYVELSPEQFYARLRTASETPSTSQPTPGDFLAAYEELAGFERILSIHIAAKLSGTIESARAAARELGDDRVRTIDSESASAAIAMLGLAIQRGSSRGPPTRRSMRSSSATAARPACSSPSTRSSTSRAEAASAVLVPGPASC